MIPGRDNNKDLTSTTGVGTSNASSSGSNIVGPTPEIITTTGNVQYQGEDDSINYMAGPGHGDIISGSDPNPQRWGYNAPSGSRIEVNDAAGAERIDIVHRSGAAVQIEADGSVFITSKSQRGAGVSAPMGDYYISSGGNVVIKGGASITVDTPGDFTLNVGGTFYIKAREISTTTGNIEEIVDGSKTTSIKNDYSSIIGGISRNTVAGDARFQVSGEYQEDIGGDKTNRIGGDHTISSAGNLSVYAGGDSNITAAGDSTLYAGANINVSGSGQATVYSGGPVKLTGSIVNASPYVDLAEWADRADVSNTAGALGGGAGGPPAAQAGSAGEAGEASDPQVMEANDIVDTLTSQRQFPEYPGNGVLESASAAGLGMISHDQMPGAQAVFDNYSGGNQGNFNPPYQSSNITTLPDTPINRDPNIAPIDPNTPIPAQGALNSKISKYFTLGQIINGTTTQHIPPASQWNSIVGNGVKLAQNVLDPIKERFPDILVTSWFRWNSNNHITGRTIDIVVQSRSTSKHAEIARFARDNLPVDQVFLEKNTSGRTHVHLRVSNGTGNPSVLTCGDPNCTTRTPGIDVAYLLRKGAPNT